MMFGGTTYEPQRDGERLKAQLDRVRALMSDGEWRTLAEIAAFARGSEAAASARLRDLRKAQFGKRTVLRRYVANGVWEYRLVPQSETVDERQLGLFE